jgi:hypothetical protein
MALLEFVALSFGILGRAMPKARPMQAFGNACGSESPDVGKAYAACAGNRVRERMIAPSVCQYWRNDNWHGTCLEAGVSVCITRSRKRS